MIDKLPNGIVVRDYQSIEAPFISKHLLKGKFVGRGRLSIQVVKGGHIAQTSIYTERTEGCQIDISEDIFRDKSSVVISSSFCCSIAYIMLAASRYWSYVIQVFSLKTFHNCWPHHWSQERILAETLGNSSPSWISSDINHGCESPLDAHRRAFDSSNSTACLCQGGVEGSCLREWYGKDGSKAVNDIFADEEWYFKSGLFHGYFLHLVDVF